MVCAQWNVPAERIAESADVPEAALQLRIVAETPAATCIVEQPVEPTATESFVAVPEARAPYHAELGVRTAEGDWQVLAVSASTTTPPDSPIVDFSYSESVWNSPAVEPWYPDANPVTLPGTDVSASHRSDAPMAASRVHRTRPPSKTSTLRILALSQDESWGEAFASHSLSGRRSGEGLESEEETDFAAEQDWAQGHLAPPGDHPSSGSLGSEVGAESGPEGLPSSLPAVPPTRGRKFWFKINAEVILYGSTEPDATVTIGSYPVKLRPDGTFSFRFALPDGEFPLPVVAVAADGHDGRAATVTFRRATQTMGLVGVHPQDPALQPPHPENAL